MHDAWCLTFFDAIDALCMDAMLCIMVTLCSCAFDWHRIVICASMLCFMRRLLCPRICEPVLMNFPILKAMCIFAIREGLTMSFIKSYGSVYSHTKFGMQKGFDL